MSVLLHLRATACGAFSSCSLVCWIKYAQETLKSLNHIKSELFLSKKTEVM